jgi:diguanylate cyclase
MTDQESSDRSAELLRLTLPKMSRHGGGYHPVSYALWYDYVSGENEALRAAVDAALASQERLSHAATHELYQRYLVDRAEEAVSKARTELMALLGQMESSVHRADSQTSGFNTHLDNFGREIARSDSMADLKNHVGGMMDQVRALSQSLGALHGELGRGRDEVRRLSDELQRVRDEVLTDPLTGLLNRRGFDRALDESLDTARSGGAPLSLVMLDIDHFKRVNDSYGHVFGDRVLHGVAAAIRSSIGRVEAAARYGGEEFAVVLPDLDLDAACAKAEHIRSAVERSRIRKANGETIGNLTVSAGVATYRPGEEALVLVERADKALYASKSAGRNRVTALPA